MNDKLKKRINLKKYPRRKKTIKIMREKIDTKIK
jgi:hypothetical protein